LPSGFCLRFLLARRVVFLEFLRLPRMLFWALYWWLQCQLAIGVWDMFLDNHFLCLRTTDNDEQF
jgi:hypothetical protein